MLPPLRLHHVGILVRDIESAAREYVSHMGYSVRTPKLHDPAQTAYVQFLALPGERTLLELVAPDSPRSRLTNALRKGGGLNHLCYAAPDIEATCRDWRAAGFFLIHAPMPAVAFSGRSIAWLMNSDCVLMELVEEGPAGEL